MKYIDAEKLIAEIEKRLSIFEHGIAYDCWASCKKVVEYLQQEQPEAIGGVVHHALGNHWLEVNQKQLCARLKQFPEGAEVGILVNARKEE